MKEKNYTSMNDRELIDLAEVKGLKLPTIIENELNSFGNDFKVEYSRKYVINELRRLEDIESQEKNLRWVKITVAISFLTLLISIYPFIYKLLKLLISIFEN